MTFQDKWSRYHDKPCDGEPSSNNGWYFTAIAVKIGLPVDAELLTTCYLKCWDRQENFMNRSPGKTEPPMSRDEVLGCWYLKMYMFRPMVAVDWKFCPYEIPSFNPLKTLAAFWRLSRADRNAVWENGGEPHAWRFAFSVPYQDRAYMLRMEGFENWFYTLFERLSNLSDPVTPSSRLLRWFKSDKAPDLQLFIDYFGENHLFVTHIKESLK